MTDTERAHMIDDMEQVRTHPIRTINSIDPLLSLALDALTAGDLHVVREFMERTQKALRDERTWLTHH